MYRAAQIIIGIVCRVLFGLRYEGAENVPSQGGVLLAANHKSYLDPPVVGSGVRRPIHYFAKKELFRIPLFGRMIRGFGSVPVDRTGFDRRAIAEAITLLEQGEGLLVFPEGSRIRRRGYAEPREGIALLALRAGVPIVPVHIASTWEPARRGLRRIPIRVRYGRPISFGRIEPGPAARARYKEIARTVMEEIERLGRQP